MLASLQRDVIHFSSAKDYAMRRAMANELIDSDGKLRTFSQYRNAAYGIADTHVNTWLRAEYDLSINAAQMAAKWVNIKKQVDVFGLLQFDAVIDDHTTKICFSLDGVIRPVDDPFWDTYYPPNHFGCRSTVRQLDDGDVTPGDDIVYPDNIPDIFKTNLAKKGLAYPPAHPYYEGMPDNYGELKLLRQETLQNARKHVGTNVSIDKIGNVEITWQGLKEISNQGHSDKVKQLQLLQVLPQLLQHAEHVTSVSDTKVGGNVFHYARVKGLENFFLNIKETQAGKKVLYSITDNLK